MASLKIYALTPILLSVFAAGIFTLPSVPDGNRDIFARCEVCHTQNAETTKTSQHNLMGCIEYHTISGFVNETHNATIPGCNLCHEDTITGLQHKKLRYSPEQYFIYNPEITSDNNGIYINLIEPSNTTINYS